MPGYDYTFVGEVQAEYSCPICECPMREPVQTKCGHRFCKECLEKSLKRRRKCPIDRRTLDEHNPTDIYPDVAIKRTILDFTVKCPNESNGCKWTGELRNVETHEATCEFIEVECTNKDCKITPLKKNLLKHLTSECPMRNVECQYCKTCFVWRLKKDHSDVCTKYPVPCRQKCDEHKIPRDKMNDHIKNSCPHTKVDCTFAHIGCKVKVQRRAIGDHVKASTAAHLKLACEKLQEFRALSSVNTINIKQLEAQMDTANKKITNLSEIFLKRVESLQELRDRQMALTEKKLNELEKRDEKLRDAVNELQILVPKCNRVQHQLREEFTWTKGKLQELEEAFSKLDQRQSEESYERWSDNEKEKRKLQKLEEAFSKLDQRQSEESYERWSDNEKEKRKLQKLEEAFSKLNQRQCKESYDLWSDNEKEKRKLQKLEEAFSKLNQRQCKESYDRCSDYEGIESRLQNVALSVKEVRDQLSANQTWWKNFRDVVGTIFCIIVCVIVSIIAKTS